MSAPHVFEKTNQNSPQPSRAKESPETQDTMEIEDADHGHGVEWTELSRIAFVAFAAAAVWFHVWEPFPRISVIGIAAALIGGYPIFKEDLREHR